MTVKAKEDIAFVPETPKKTNRNTISYYFNKLKDKNEVQSIPETPNIKKSLKINKVNEENGTPNIFKKTTIHVEQSPIQFGKKNSYSKLIDNEESKNSKASSSSLLASDIRRRFEFKPRGPPIASLNDKKHYFKPFNNSNNTIPNRQSNPFSNSNLFKTDSTIMKENNQNNLSRKSSIISIDSDSDSNSNKSNFSIFNQNGNSISPTNNDIFSIKKNKIPRIIDDSDDEDRPRKMEIDNKGNTRMNAYILILTDMFPHKSREEIIEAFQQSKLNLKKAAEILKNGNSNNGSTDKKKNKKRTKKRLVIESDEEESMNSYDESDSSDLEYKGNKRRKYSNTISKSSDSEDDDDTLLFFNKATSQEMQDMISICSPEQAEIIISHRPYRSITALKRTLNKEKGISGKIVENYEEVINGYNVADSIIESCEKISKELTGLFNTWGVDKKGRLLPGVTETGKGFLSKQPEIINSSMILKNYQLLGVSWLTYMYLNGFSGILADEMGLGKTAQVISFLGNIYSNHNENGPFLIIVPSSTKDNWLREFEKWCPELEVRAYYGSQFERAELRHELRKTKGSYNIILTTYQIASNQKEDRAFLKHMNFKIMILDEGHMMKNMTSLRYKHLMTINSDCRFLLTGTPIQNTLQELIVSFIL